MSLKIETLEFDVIVIGAGGSGLRSTMGCLHKIKDSLFNKSISY